MLLSVLKHMQVAQVVVERVAVNVVDYLPRLCAGDLPVLLLSTRSLAAVTEAVRRGSKLRAVPVGLLNRGIRNHRLGVLLDGGNHFVASSHVCARLQALNLLGIGVERIAMSVPHLVVPHAHLSGHHRPVAVLTGSADLFPAPSVVRRAVLLGALVVHQAQAVCSVFATASLNRADAVQGRGSHRATSQITSPNSITNKALGNSMAVNVMRVIGTRIAMVDALEAQEAAA